MPFRIAFSGAMLIGADTRSSMSRESHMKIRRIIAIVVAFVALPLLLLGLIDPLEGGLALLAAIVLGFVVWLLSRVRIPKLAWISMIATVVIGAIVLIIAITKVPVPDASGTVVSPLSGGILGLLWVYRLGVLVTLAGAVLYVVRLFQSLRQRPLPASSTSRTSGA